MLATLVSHARFEALGTVEPGPHATLRPAGPMPMRVRLRKRVAPRAA